jgi:hypothetical protein
MQALHEAATATVSSVAKDAAQRASAHLAAALQVELAAGHQAVSLSQHELCEETRVHLRGGRIGEKEGDLGDNAGLLEERMACQVRALQGWLGRYMNIKRPIISSICLCSQGRSA